MDSILIGGRFMGSNNDIECFLASVFGKGQILFLAYAVYADTTGGRVEAVRQIL